MGGVFLEFSIVEAADKGGRSYQEDTTRFWRGHQSILAVLSDGMGGHVSGEVASREVATKFVETVKSSATEPIERVLERALILSNDAISERVRKDPALKGMGCTLVAAHLSREGLRWVSVGDSSLLLYRDHQLIRMNEDHSIGSLLDRQVEEGLLSEAEAKADPRRRVLRSALVGAPLTVREIEVAPYPLQHNDWVILASDGLETLTGDEISHILHEFLDDHVSPRAVADKLLAEVKRRNVPNQDNVSIIVTRVVDPSRTDTRIIPSETMVKAPAVAALTTTAPPKSVVPPPPRYLSRAQMPVTERRPVRRDPPPLTPGPSDGSGLTQEVLAPPPRPIASELAAELNRHGHSLAPLTESEATAPSPLASRSGGSLDRGEATRPRLAHLESGRSSASRSAPDGRRAGRGTSLLALGAITVCAMFAYALWSAWTTSQTDLNKTTTSPVK